MPSPFSDGGVLHDKPFSPKSPMKAQVRCLLACTLFARLGFGAVPAGVLGLSVQGHESIDAVIPFDSRNILGNAIAIPSEVSVRFLFWDAGIQTFQTTTVSNGVWLSDDGEPSPLAESESVAGSAFRLQNPASEPVPVFVFGTIPDTSD